MTEQQQSLFSQNWCLLDGLPKTPLDPSLKYFCRHVEKKQVAHNFVESFVTPVSSWLFGYPFGLRHDAPMGLNVPYAPQEIVWGLANLVLHPFEDRVIGYAFLYEVDYKIMEAYRHELEAHQLGELIARYTGTCLVLRSTKGWHFASLNIIPLEVFHDLANQCQIFAPSDFHYLDLRISPTANESQMRRFQQFYTAKSPYPVSSRHRALWEIVLKSENIKLIPQQTEVESSRILHLKYIKWG